MLETGGQVAQAVIGGFAGSPAMLLIVVLNVAMILAAAYFLARLEETRAASIQRIGDLLDKCIGDTVPTAALQLMGLGGYVSGPRTTRSILPASASVAPAGLGVFEPPEDYTLGQDDELSGGDFNHRR
jgi:hypothetical protein